MNIMVVGGGGREHAIIQKLLENPSVHKIYALPGNGGIAEDAVCVPIAATDLDAIVTFAVSHSIDFAVVAPDDPLVLGAVDRLEERGIPCFGPNARAAIIEGSKAFAKNLMRKYGIPTASYAVFDCCSDACAYLKSQNFPIVIKADGLALGKGVIIAQTMEEGERTVRSMMEDGLFGESGRRVIIEEYLTGPEVSVLAFTDGRTIVPMVSSMDHKRVLDGDGGPNTGGMGAIAPNPYYTDVLAKQCMEQIFMPTIRAMCDEGRPFKGCLYFGLMLTPQGPKVIEYNCRFGDPETQVVLPLMETDLLTVMQHVHAGTLGELSVTFSNRFAACVVIASGGYPRAYQTRVPITIGDTGDAFLYHAGSKLEQDGLVTAGGRVLGVTALGDTLQEAVRKAYVAVSQVQFNGAYYRRDIGKKAMEAAGE